MLTTVVGLVKSPGGPASDARIWATRRFGGDYSRLWWTLPQSCLEHEGSP